jgi:uncharacterized repeat protein (TIGR03809 family)
MPAPNGGLRIDEMARKWLALAERRLAHLIVLYRSDRWQRYYVKERFVLHMRDTIRAVDAWRRLAGQAPTADKNDLRPAA